MYTHIDVRNFFEEHNQLITHYLVAHTNLRPSNMPTHKIESMATSAKKSLRYTLNCFAKLVNPSSPNNAYRKANRFRPLSIVTIEHLSPNITTDKTIHFNILLGNINPKFKTRHIEAIFRHCWVDMAHQSENLFITEFDNNPRLLSYSLKEAEKSNTLSSVGLSAWDVENTFIPSSPAFID